MQERSLLFGLLALRNELVSREQLVTAFEQWMGRPKDALEQLLVDSGALAEADRAFLDELVKRHLEANKLDVTHSLRALSGLDSVRDELTGLANTELRETLVHLGAGQGTAPAGSTEQAGVGQFSSSGVRFQVRRKLDEGGLGIVNVAVDRELNRDVALKEIRPERADDPFFRAKFLLEAEVTGGLEHPGIVPVYGLGVDDGGRPFYAMRLIRGDNLRKHIRQFHRERIDQGLPYDGMPLRKLLRRFLDVCDAIAYAHARGVLHRDLKPGNVMLGTHGETLVVDWGLAKPLGTTADKSQDEREAEYHETPLLPSASDVAATQAGSALGTAAYAPPEQLTGDYQRVGPRSDVYGLGAILYELLTGSAPAEGKVLEDVIRQVTNAEIRSPRSVVPQVPRHLEAICLRAMAPEPDGRFDSAVALQNDVERWLDDQPIEALPDGPVMRVRRWLRRNRGVAVTATVGLLLLTVVSLIAAVIIDQARRREAELAIENGRLAKAERRQKERATAVTDFLTSSFEVADPARGGRDVTVVEILDSARKEAAEEFKNQPLTRSAIYHALGVAYMGLGELEDAETMYRDSLELDEEGLGPTASDTITARNNLAAVLYKLSKYDEAEVLIKKNLDLVGPNTLSPALLNNYAELLVTRGSHSEARKFFRTAEEQARQADPVDERLLAVIPMNLARIDLIQENYADAVKQYREARERLTEVFGEDHPMTLICLSNLAAALSRNGQEDESMELKLQTIEIKNRVLGETHPDTLASKNNLAISYMRVGENEKAVPLFEEVFAHTLEFMPVADPRRLDIAERLASLHLSADRKDRAETFLEAIVAALKEAKRPSDTRFAGAVERAARLYAEIGATDKALEMLDVAIKQLTDAVGADHEMVQALNNVRAEISNEC